MEGSYEQEKGNKKFTGITTFPVPYAVGKFKENIAITTNSPFDPSKEEKIIKQAFKLHLNFIHKEIFKKQQIITRIF